MKTLELLGVTLLALAVVVPATAWIGATAGLPVALLFGAAGGKLAELAILPRVRQAAGK
jgi:uncharacterized membrane protein